MPQSVPATADSPSDTSAAERDAEPLEARDERLLFWITQAGLFLLILVGVSTVFISLTSPAIPRNTVPALILLRMLTIAGAAALMGAVYRLPVVNQLRFGGFVAAVLAICLVTALLELITFQLIAWLVLPIPLGFVERYPAFAVLARFFVCIIWSSTFFLLRQRATARRSAAAATQAELRATKAEVALRESELERLGQHVEPHFLFNALSAVLACRHDPDAVEAVTTALSEYLRFCLSRDGSLAPLALEVDAIEQLLAVHEARFGSDLRCSVGASPAARRIAVPPLVLAPLVDNALKFASQTSSTPWVVTITAHIIDERLMIEVTNSGRWVEPSPERPGTGLAHLRRRLELCDVNHSLELLAENDTVTARLSLPARQLAATA